MLVALSARSAYAQEPVGEADVAWLASLEWDQTYNADGVTVGGEPSWNPQYAWAFTAAAGYRPDDLTTLMLRQPWAVELTDSDVTSTRQEWWLLDTSFELARDLLFYEPAPDHTLQGGGSARVLFPTSKQSQARTMILGTRAAFDASYRYKHVLHGIGAGLSLSYLHRFTSSDTVQSESSFPCFRTGSDVSENCTHLGGSSVTTDLFTLGMNGSLAITEALDVGLEFSLGWNRGHGFDRVEVPIQTGSVTVEDQSTTHWRNTRAITLLVGYAFTDFFSATAHLDNEFAEIANGERRGPFRALDTELGLSLLVRFDQLVMYTQK